MKILIIDNGTKRQKELAEMCEGHAITVIQNDQFLKIDTEKYNLLILSGSQKMSIVGNNKYYGQEIELIKSAQIPILGICAGFELIMYAYGAMLYQLQKKEEEIIELKITKDNALFNRINNLKVYSAHRWLIKRPPKEFNVLARSKRGIEIIEHKSRPLFGFQFHPEMYPEKTCGYELFSNFINLIK